MSKILNASDLITSPTARMAMMRARMMCCMENMGLPPGRMALARH